MPHQSNKSMPLIQTIKPIQIKEIWFNWLIDLTAFDLLIAAMAGNIITVIRCWFHIYKDKVYLVTILILL